MTVRALPRRHVVTACLTVLLVANVDLAAGHAGPASAVDGAASQSAWRQFHFSPNHAGVNPGESILTPQNVSKLELGWLFAMDDGATTAPAVSDGLAFVASRRSLYAIDLASGSELWDRHEFLADWTSPAVWKGRVYVGSGGRAVVRALDAQTGRGVWTFHPAASVFNLTVADGLVFFTDVSDDTYAIDARTGRLRWRTPVNGGTLSNPTVANGRVYVMGFSHDLQVLDESDGSLLWTGDIGTTTDSTPTVVDGMVYVGSGYPDQTLFAFDAEGCGQALCPPTWTATTGGTMDSSPVVYRGTVFIGSNDGSVYAFDATTGTIRWSRDLGSPGFFLSSPVVAGNVLFIGGGSVGWIWAVDPANGAVLWSYETGVGTAPAPAIVDGWVYVGSHDANLYAFHLPAVPYREPAVQ